jgi:integrase
MAATIRNRETGKLDKFGNAVVSYQVRWREPVRDEFGAPTGQFRQTSETFETERKAKAHQRKVEDQLESAYVDPSSAKAKANKPLGEYTKQYLDGLAGTPLIHRPLRVMRRSTAPTLLLRSAKGQLPVSLRQT